MLIFSLGVTKMDRIKNDNIGAVMDKIREAMLRWFKHVQRRHGEYLNTRC